MTSFFGRKMQRACLFSTRILSSAPQAASRALALAHQNPIVIVRQPGDRAARVGCFLSLTRPLHGRLQLSKDPVAVSPTTTPYAASPQRRPAAVAFAKLPAPSLDHSVDEADIHTKVLGVGRASPLINATNVIIFTSK